MTAIGALKGQRTVLPNNLILQHFQFTSYNLILRIVIVTQYSADKWKFSFVFISQQLSFVTR